MNNRCKPGVVDYLRGRWKNLVRRINSKYSVRDLQGVFNSFILPFYQTFPRCYHTLDHIYDCLLEFDKASSLATFKDEVEIALWFHDVVSYSEAKSCEIMKNILMLKYKDQESWIESYIMATTHQIKYIERTLGTNEAVDAFIVNDQCLVADIDIAIFGKNRSKYIEFESKIRKEFLYARTIFNQERLRVLQAFLNRKKIYYHEYFQKKYERRARENLQWSIKNLTKQLKLKE